MNAYLKRLEDIVLQNILTLAAMATLWFLRHWHTLADTSNSKEVTYRSLLWFQNSTWALYWLSAVAFCIVKHDIASTGCRNAAGFGKRLGATGMNEALT